MWYAAMAQLVEHILGKDEVPGPNPGSSSKNKKRTTRVRFLFLVSATPSSERVFAPPVGAKAGSVLPRRARRARS